MSIQNPYETAQQKIIPAVLLYAFYQDSVLMIHRNSKPNDTHAGKWNGLGGKLEPGETSSQAAAREFLEESFSDVPSSQWNWMGQLHFPNFKSTKNEDWWVTVWVTDLTDEQAKKIPLNSPQTSEGALHFIEKTKILNLNLWEGDRHFLPLVLDHTPFQGTFYYENGKCVRHELAKIAIK